MMSPAAPTSSLEFKTALYSVGAEGVNFTLMVGLSASKAGIILPYDKIIVGPAFHGQMDIFGLSNC